MSPTARAPLDATHDKGLIKALISLIISILHSLPLPFMALPFLKKQKLGLPWGIRDTSKKYLVYSRCLIGGDYFQCEATLALTSLFHIALHPPVPVAETSNLRPSSSRGEGILPLKKHRVLKGSPLDKQKRSMEE